MLYTASIVSNRGAGKMKVLVTGVAGFIGSHIADELLALGHEVVGLDDLSGGFLENVPAGVDFVKMSVVDHDEVEALFKKHRFESIFHLAAYAAEGLSHFIRRFNYNTNLIGSINLLNSAVRNGTRCFVFTSSIAVYGAGQLPMTEDMQPSPEDPYGISKYAFEMDLKAAHEMFGIDYVIFRPHNVYGERQNIADRYRNVIGIFINQALQGRSLSIFGDGEQTRAFTYISDVAPIIARAPEVVVAQNQIFNVGADTPYTVNVVADTVSKALDVPLKVEHLPARKEVVHAYSSHKKTQKFFGSHQKVSLDEGIARMGKWVRERGACEPVTFGDIEVEKNMPQSWQSIIASKKGAN
jgi:UDP-glucose 4-epimerase